MRKSLININKWSKNKIEIYSLKNSLGNINFKRFTSNISKDALEMKRKLNNLYRFQTSSSSFKKEENTEDKTNEQKNESKEVKDNIVVGLAKSFVTLWRSTFPKEIDYSTHLRETMEQQKEIKSKIKYSNDKEIEEYKANTPLWRQGAVVLVLSQESKTQESILQTYKSKLKKIVINSESYSKLKSSENYKEYEQFKEDLEVIKSNIKENIVMSYNPLIVAGKDIFVSF